MEDQLAASIPNFRHHERFHQPSTVGDGRDRGDQLQRRDADLLPDRNRRQRPPAVVPRFLHQACRLARQIDFGPFAEPERRKEAMQARLAEGQSGLDRPDIAGSLDHLSKGHPAGLVVVMNDRVGHYHPTLLSIDQRPGRQDLFLERGGRHEDLHR